MSRKMFAVVLTYLLTIGACYDPSLDGEGKFYCTDAQRLCPDGFVCDGDLCVKGGAANSTTNTANSANVKNATNTVEPGCRLEPEALLGDCDANGQFGATTFGGTLLATFANGGVLHSAFKLTDQQWKVEPADETTTSGFSAVLLWPSRIFLVYRDMSGQLVLLSIDPGQPKESTVAILPDSTGSFVSLARHPESDKLLWVAYQAPFVSAGGVRKGIRVAVVDRDTAKVQKTFDITAAAGAGSSNFVAINSSPQGGVHLAFLVTSTNGTDVFRSSYEGKWTAADRLASLQDVPNELKGVAVAVDTSPYFVYPSPEGLMFHDDPEPVFIEPSGGPSLALDKGRQIVAFLSQEKAMVVHREGQGNPWSAPIEIDADGRTTQVRLLVSSPNVYELFYRQRVEARAVLYHRTIRCNADDDPQRVEPEPPRPAD